MDGTTQKVDTKWIEVLVDCPGTKTLYTYRVPEDTEIYLGDIVSVPFGRSQVGGIAIRALDVLPEGLNPASIRTIESVINHSFFTKEYWQLLVGVARYYQTPLIRVIRTALPPGLLSRSQRRIRLRSPYLAAKAGLVVENEHWYRLVEGKSQPVQALAKRLFGVLKSSPTGDYSWQHVQRQLANRKGGAGRSAGRREINQALQALIGAGVVENFLVTPRSPQAQKRQAVFLINTASGASADSDLSKRQREILLALEREGGELWLSDALQILSTTSKTLKKIEAQGYLVIEPKEMLRAGSHSRALPDRPKTLTGDQARALSVLRQMQGDEEALLHGVTGSGKTEVYLQAIAPLLGAQKSALVLVPEIGLTPQLTDRFRSRFGDRVCVYHSGLSEGERYDTWRQMLSGEPQVIIGTRSAVFSPLPNLGMIILDEEHDGSFKQDQPMPCYHARKVARWRAKLEDCPLVLGSATPSIETWVRFRANRQEGYPTGSADSTKSAKGSLDFERLHYLSLPRRVHARPAPPVEVIDMRKELHEGNRTIFSRPLQLALEELVEQGNQGILFIHRRGHSSFVSCRSCGHVMECPNCDVSLSFHQTHQNATARLKCHYCGFGQAHPKECPACASPYLKNFGSGTQRVVNELAKYLPQARCIRFDSDTTRNKGAHRALLTRFAQGEADLLVGTQMLTKGIDLPQVTLVGVIAADGLLFMPDYRASERAFQTMTQAAGRAGRGEQKGRVIVQTYSPEHTAIKALTQGGHRGEAQPGDAQSGKSQTGEAEAVSQVAAYGTFLQGEMSDRADQQYPPYGRLILLRLSGLDAPLVETTAEKLAAQIQADLADADACKIMGPVPAPIFRVARRYRWHILLKLDAVAPLPDLKPLQQKCPKGVSLTIDVEPLNLS